MRTSYVVVRLLEWRAAWFSDPAERLRFLQRARPERSRAVRTALVTLALGLASASIALVRPVWNPAPPPKRHLTLQRAAAKSEVAPGRVWLVESNERFDLYSNGLRVENPYAGHTQSRAYLAFARDSFDARLATLRLDPAGIVYHTTESHMAPFEEDQNVTLRRAGEGLLEFVRRNRSYHFVIDRFGRVFRVVPESDYANHAGHSIWADQRWVYINLNQSFFGVAFEAKSRPEEPGPPVNPAQVHAARILTEMLRARYRIAAGNCVAHAQVSVNPVNGRAGYHTDWAADLPFGDLGLSDNYRQPLPSVLLFGFQPDSLLAAEPAVEMAEALLAQQAAARGIPVARYREILQKRYKDAIASSGRKTDVHYE